MESVIFEDSPLAAYLEGNGEHSSSSSPATSRPSTSATSTSFQPTFAPTGASTSYTKYRRKVPKALVIQQTPANVVVKFKSELTDVLKARLRPRENARFLERFRYVVIASQLLSSAVGGNFDSPASYRNTSGSKTTIFGVTATIFGAFATVWTSRTGWEYFKLKIGILGWLFVTTVIVGLLFSIYLHFTKLRLRLLREHTLSSITNLVTTAQNCEAAITAALTIVQEVEIVSRGYRLSTPLPPVSRLEDQSRTRRCQRLRHVLRSSLDKLVAPYISAYMQLKAVANEADLDKYHDMYDITRADLDEVEDYTALQSPADLFDDHESLTSFRISLAKLLLLRKVFLCLLLAIDADGTENDHFRWQIAVQSMDDIAKTTSEAHTRLDAVLGEHESFSRPTTPKSASQAQTRLKTQLRRLGALSNTIRTLQAKMIILREESDKALDDDDTGELSPNLLQQYDSIGADLETLTEQWQDGRAALTASINRQRHRSMSSRGSLFSSRSATPSSLDATLLNSSPAEALQILSGKTSDTPIGSDEEVFEAIALPRQRVATTREERILKMKEDRARDAERREQRDASGNMIRELETVIKMRPRGRTTGALNRSSTAVT